MLGNINKTIKIDVPIIGDIESVITQLLNSWEKNNYIINEKNINEWWNKIESWKKIDCLNYEQGTKIIKTSTCY